MNTFFSSDHHFHHARVIEYCGRPFKDVYDMDRTMVARWNARVQPYDTVYYLGDFSFGTKAQVMGMLARLNGTIHLIRGNHDRSASAMLEAGFGDARNSEVLCMNGLVLNLRHIPPPASDYQPGRTYKPEFLTPPPCDYDYWLCGHVHEKWRRKGNVINVGVDQWNFAPVTLEELLACKES